MPACRFFGCIAAALLCPTLALAQSAAPPPAAIGGFGNWLRPTPPLAVSSKPHPSVARIMVPERDGVAFGSGTLVDVNGDQGLVITNWHVVRDAAGEIEVAFPDGYRSKAKVLKTDKDWDLAALVIWKPNVAPVALSPTAPQPGEVLTIAGYGSGNFRAATAKCTQYVSPGHALPFEMVEIGTEARQGDSGGPILNQRGEIAGVLFGAGGGTTSGSYVGRVRTFLATVSPRLADPAAPATPPPVENIASTNPFLNPQAVPHLVQEATARAAAPGIQQPPAGDGWHASKHDPVAVAADQMEAIKSTTPRVEVPISQFASRKTEITFGSLPEQTSAAPVNLSHDSATAMAEEPLKLWSRPLPIPEPEVTANTGTGSNGIAPAATDPVQAMPGPLQDEALQALIGVTLFDQAKSLLAVLGMAAVGIRLLRSPTKSDD